MRNEGRYEVVLFSRSIVGDTYSIVDTYDPEHPDLCVMDNPVSEAYEGDFEQMTQLARAMNDHIRDSHTQECECTHDKIVAEAMQKVAQLEANAKGSAEVERDDYNRTEDIMSKITDSLPNTVHGQIKEMGRISTPQIDENGKTEYVVSYDRAMIVQFDSVEELMAAQQGKYCRLIFEL
jgi:hypothetical protein